MSPDKLIRSANQIAVFHQSQPEATRIRGVAAHLNDFWDPNMRAQLLEMLRTDPEPFHDLVRAAGMHLRAPSVEMPR
jgi:formate dehydrogenase subunit delta